MSFNLFVIEDADGRLLPAGKGPNIDPSKLTAAPAVYGSERAAHQRLAQMSRCGWLQVARAAPAVHPDRRRERIMSQRFELTDHAIARTRQRVWCAVCPLGRCRCATGIVRRRIVAIVSDGEQLSPRQLREVYPWLKPPRRGQPKKAHGRGYLHPLGTAIVRRGVVVTVLGPVGEAEDWLSSLIVRATFRMWVCPTPIPGMERG